MNPMLKAFAIAGLLATPVAAAAQEEIPLIIASSHPTTVPWIGMIKTNFMPKVDEILAGTGNYKIAWQEAFGGQLYKANATLTSVEQGVTDIGWVFSYLEAPKMPLSQVTAYTPFATNSPPAQLDTMRELYETVPEFKQEWEQYNIVLLGMTGSDSYDLFTKSPVRALDDLSGLKISAPGPLGTWLRGLGANAVDGALPTFYTDIQTGISDGVLSLAMGVLPVRLYEVAPYITRVNAGVVFSGGLAINKDTWDGLPEEVQTALRQAGEAYSEAHAEDLVTRHEAALQKIVELGKDQSTPVVIADMPADQRQAWVDALPDLAGEWVTQASARGLPAKAFINAYLEGLVSRGETPARDWTVAE